VVRGDYAYFAHGLVGIRIYDISVAQQPYEIGQFETPDASVNISLRDNLAYISLGLGGIQVLDVSEPGNVSLIAEYNTPGWAECIYPMDDSTIYVADRFSLLALRFDPQTGIIEEVDRIPRSFSLFPNYPNPFNASTTISYELPVQSDVRLEIYDILGRKVETLVNDIQLAGRHWVIWEAEDASSGVYFYKIQTREYSWARNCILLK
jgi:hypothetical protein